MHAHVRALALYMRLERQTTNSVCALNFCDCLNMTFRVEIRARTHSADTYLQARECEPSKDGILRSKSFLPLLCHAKFQLFEFINRDFPRSA